MNLKDIKQRVGRLSQVGGTRHYRLSDGRAEGTRAIDVDTGAGLQFTVLPDRAMDISRCSFRGTNVAFHAPGGETHPAYYHPAGYEWLRSFYAGLLTTCGLTYFGHPVQDGADSLGLHGRVANLPATQVSDLSGEDAQGNHLIHLRGIVEEAVLFGDKLRLTRNIRTRLGARSLFIEDEVHNWGFKPAPLTILYHFNLGHPLLHEEAQIVMPEAPIRYYDDASRQEEPNRLKVKPPAVDAGHTVYHYMLEGEGTAAAALINRPLGLGLYIRFDRRQLPVLNNWKCFNAGEYVMGIEPGNARIVDRPTLREAGELQTIQPGETRRFNLEVGILEGIDEINSFKG